MPTPKPNESKDDWMDRCMGDSKMVDEFGNPQQRAAVCNTYFEDRGKEKTASVETVEALQYGKPDKDDPRKTPAKPSERRKGSKKNKKDSASKPNESIKMSKETEASIRKLMEEHNKKDKGSKASMGMLKSVFRRGAGAFSRSHAPNMSRNGWGLARVKAFLYLLRNGRPSNPNYKQDNDLLPKSHPRADEEYEDWGEPFSAAEYQGKKVTLNKPFRTQGGKKKFAVYVQNKAGRVIIVRFGDPNMEIKRDDPKRRKAFRDRHNCSEAKDKTTPKYWSCRQWSTNKVEANNDMTEESVESSMGGCGCGCAGESVEAAEPKPKSDETHDQYMSRCQNMGYSKEECMKAHEGHTFKDQDEAHEDTDHDASYHDDKKKMRAYECPIGEEMVDGKCIRVAVTCEIQIDSIEARIEASTGKSVMRITGVAFTDGVNKNSWGIRPALAQRLTNDMVGADVTLNHPKSEMGRFRRNMDGGVDEATVGVVTEASYHQTSRGYEVRYVAEVHRAELFASLESGLWMRPEYGVSIGGTGIPSEIVEATEEGGRATMWFADDFEFDHLAIVHRPAYADANIETVEKVIANETFMYQPESSTDYSKVNNMTEEQIESTASEMEALQAELVLREAKIAEYEAADLARAEDARLELVKKASDMGLKGHDDFTTETLNSVIASWESSRPAPAEEPVVDMAPATPAVSEPVEASEESSEPVVANYLNGKIVESSESLYARCYNSWANAYNTVMAGADMQKAKLYEELN
tara:strand:+ start:2527 stop:4782 length:2256 start_codon:yes stop_codon:yes gene_type:complete